jgi:hypothetical protein
MEPRQTLHIQYALLKTAKTPILRHFNKPINQLGFTHTG